MIRESNHAVAFTGAGISVESGIPDFRSPGGLWSKYDVNIYGSWAHFQVDPGKYWTMSRELSKTIFAAGPNKAHLALARLEAMGKLSAVITQNIDNLHYRAGNKKVLELHGNYRTVHCMDCNEQYSRKEILPRLNAGEIPPTCKKCGGVLRSDAVLFGQPLPQETMTEATDETLKSDLFIVIGSSLSVYPAVSLPVMAKENGAKLIIINLEMTPLDNLADLVINDKASEILTAIISELK